MKSHCHLVTVALIFSFLNAPAQNSFEFDSLKVFYLKFKSNQGIKIDEFYLTSIGDSIKVFDMLNIDSIYHDLIYVGRKCALNPKKVNKNYTRKGIDLRLLFEFYKNGVKTSIGFSHSLLFFIENKVLYYKMEDLINIKKKYQKLSPALAGVY